MYKHKPFTDQKKCLFVSALCIIPLILPFVRIQLVSLQCHVNVLWLSRSVGTPAADGVREYYHLSHRLLNQPGQTWDQYCNHSPPEGVRLFMPLLEMIVLFQFVCLMLSKPPHRTITSFLHMGKTPNTITMEPKNSRTGLSCYLSRREFNSCGRSI